MVMPQQKVPINDEVEQLVADLQTQGVKVWVSNGQLHTRAAAGAITPALRAQIQQRKAELIALLSRVENHSPQHSIPAGVRPATLPLSFAQQRLWFMDSLGSSTAYNIPFSIQWRGAMNLAALNRAVSEIVRRHESLRTVFGVVTGEAQTAGKAEKQSEIGTVRQLICPAAPVVIPVVDLAALAPDAQQQRVRQLAEAEAIRPFDLQRDLMVRAQVVRLGEEQYQLLFTLHHIAADGWSLGVLIKEMATLYQAFCQAQPSPLPELTIQYADFALWQRDYLQDERLERQLSWWQAQLASAPPLLQLPIDHPRPAQPSYRGSAVEGVIDGSLSEGLRQLSQRQGCTLYMTLLAAFQLLLYRYTGQEEIVVGSPIANRNRAELEPMIGFFANTLALRSSMAGNPTFLELLAQVQERVQAAYDHQELPFERLVESLQTERNLAYNPLVQVIFALQNMPMGDLTLPGLQLSPLTFEVQNTRFDLELHIRETADQLHFFCVYSCDLFAAGTIERLVTHYQQLLRSIVANPHQPIVTLPLLTQAEWQQLLVDWNDTTTAYPKDKCIHHLFEEQAARTPDAVAVIMAGDKKTGACPERAEGRQEEGESPSSLPPLSPSSCLTYRELDERANQLAHHLQRLGVTTETLVGICVERSVEMVVGLLAILKAGGAYVPLDPSYPKERLAFMVQETAIPVLLTQSHVVAHLPPTTAQIVCVDQDAAHFAEENRQTHLDAGCRSANLAYVMYTSGSTGQPKGTCVLHRNVVRLVKETDFMHLGSDEVFLPLASLSFDATTLELWGPLLNGGQIVLLPPGQPTLGEIAAAIARYQITSLWLTAGLFHLMVDEQLQALRPLRQLLAGGDVLSPAHVQRVRQAIPTCRLINGYGPTENTTFTCCYTVPAGWTGETSVPIGRPIANTQVYLLDQQLQPVPIGVAGELYAGGDGVAQGYYQRPELTAEKFIANPLGAGQLYKTGDLARWLPDGNLEFLGRIDQQVKIRGFRIELGEIESVLSQQPAVQEAVVVVREDTPGDKRLVAYLVAKGKEEAANTPLTPTDLRGYLQQKLPDYMLPAAFVLLTTLPLTPNGKVDRKALPRPEQQSQTQAVYVKPQTALQQQLVEIWQQELHLDQVGIYDNFFDLGGHSLLIVKIHSRLKAISKQPLTVVDLFRYPTIHALCDYLEPASPMRKEPRPTQTHRRLIAQQGADQESIAIIGMAGRFPGADNIASLWQNLANGVEAVTFFSDEELTAAGIPLELLQDPAYVKAAAVLRDIEHFDADFFGFSQREAELLDPQIRLFLECAWEALEHAGCDPHSYPGAIGVYAGSSENTYLENHLRTALAQNSWADFYQTLTTNGKDFLATRVAYKLNLTGPAINVQTACSTSLVATHLACQSLRNGDCDVALAGGVSVHTPHRVGYRYEEGMIFTPDGHCRAFDVQSAGTIGSNGVGIVVLKRLQDALADGDVIHAVIKGSAINNDGARKVGYTAPSVDGQMNAIRQALANAAVDPATIAYIETHGTGTKLGDPIELAAIKEIFQAPIAEAVQRGTERLVLGAVKTNFGHLDAAAGITGLIKTALALKHGLVPPTLHFTAPNPELGFPQQIFQINTELLTWPAKNSPRRAGVSSFGIGGTNAHAILEEAPPPTTAPAPGRRTHHLLTLSAKNGAALQALAMEYADFLATFAAADQNAPLADICYTTHVGRSHFDHRLSIVGAAPEELRQKLLAYRPEETGTGEREGRSKQRKQRTPAPIAFLFTGQGAQYHGMGQILYETQPTFRATLDRCDGILRACLGRSLLELLYGAKTPDLPTNELLESHPCGQAVNFALECALADLWRAWGIEPDFVLGHSLGDFAAAYSAGVISLEDGLRLVTARGQFMESAHGQMVAVMAAEAEVLPFLAGVADVAIAVINGPQSVVISGAHAAIQQVNARLQAAGIKTRPLAIPVAAHSPLLDPILDDFADTVRGLTLTAPTVAVVSSMTGQLVQDEVTDPAYWRQHLRNPVRFADGVRTLYERGCRIFIEIGPKPTLLGLVEQIIDAGAAGQGAQGEIAPSAPVLLLPSLRENQDDWRQMLDSLGQLYTQGVPIDWHGFEQDYQPRKVELPTYPFQRRRYWIDAPQQKQLEKQAPKQQQQATGSIRPLIDNMVHTRAVGLTTFETAFHVAALPFLADYRLADSANRLLAPSTCQLALILDAAELAFGDTPCLLEEVVFADPLLIPTDGERTVQLLLTGNRPPNHSFPQPSDKSAVHSFDLSSFAATTQTAEDKDPTIVTHATGRLSPLRGEAPPAVDLTLLRARCTTPLDLAVRDAAGLSGIQIGPTLRWLTHLWRGEGEVLGQLALPDAVKTLTGYRIHPGVLESCLAIIASLQPASTQPALISRLGTVRCYQPVTGTAWWCHLRLTGAAIGDIQLLNEAGEFLLAITGIEVSATQWAAIQQQGESWRDWLYQVEWQPQPLAPTPPQTATHHWLIFADEQGLSEALAQTLQQRGDQVTRVCAGTAYQAVDEQTFVIRPAEATDYRRLMATLSHTTGAITDVVHCWSLDSAVTAQVCDLATGAYQSCGTTLHLVQALLHEYPTPPHLWLITRGAQAVQRQEAVTGFAQAALWGMGKTIALEHPELHCVCIDLAESTALATQSNALCAVLVADKVSAKTTVERLEPRENQLALRSGHWYAPRLQPYKPMKQYSSPNGTDLRARAPLRADATYLITGGLGGLGLAVAQWLVEQGASHLILMGRSQPTAEAQMKVARMQALGAQIRVVQADVSEEAQVAALLATISVDYPLRGIIHAAGVLADASLLQQRWQQFDQLFAPKVYGAWHLHKLTQQLPLDFFVFFSSLAGMLGNRGQANHAAANAALDALAHYRQALGLPALSINWAGWLGVGTAVRLQENGTHPSHWAGQGLGGYSPEQGVEAFANLLQQPAAQIGCMRIDWRHYLDEQRRAMPFYRSFADKAAMASQPQSRRLEAALLQAGDSAITIYTQLQQAAPKMRPALIRSELQAEVMRLLRLGSPQQIEMDQGLIELGMDSLMAIELRNRLQKSLQIKIPAAKFLEGITLTGIIDFLLEQFQTEHDAATTTMKNAVKHNEHGWETLAALPSETSLSKVKEIAL